MDFWSDLWAALTGVGTLALAFATFRTIRQSQQQRADAERQHQDQFKPICVLSPHQDLEAWNWRPDFLETLEPRPDNPGYGIVALRGVLRNVGGGPVMKLRMSFRFPDMNGWTSEPWELSPLGAGEAIGSQKQPIRLPFRIDDQFNAADFASLAGKPWEILLDYEDVFGRPFHTIHRKAVFDTDPATLSWTEGREGEQPKATLRAIPWTTYSEGRANSPSAERRAS